MQMLFQKALKNAQQVTNVELYAADELSVQRPKGNSFSKSSQFLFISSRGRYRTECRSESANTNVIKFYETAYDGSLFSGLDVNKAYMAQGDKDEPGDRSVNPLNPLIAHLVFLSKESDDCKGCRIRFTDVLSSSIASQVNLTNIQERNGFYEITVPGGRIDKKLTSWRISLAQSATNFTPKAIVRVVPGEAEVVYSFDNYTNVKNFWFPQSISYSAHAHSNITASDTLTGKTTVVSVTMPTNIPDSTFRLDEKQAKTIWNNDRQQIIKNDRVDETLESRKIARLIILFMMVVSTIIGCVLLIRNFKSAKQ